MAQGRLRKGVEKSIKAAIDAGNLDIERSAAPIALLRYLADEIDKSNGESNVLRYISPSAYLNYCKELGFFPEGVDKKTLKEEPKEAENVVSIVGNSKWKRA